MKNEPSVTLSYDEPGRPNSQNTSLPRWPFILGKIRYVTSQPDWIPRGRIEEQIVLYKSAGHLNLCVYDYVRPGWNYLDLSGSPF